jgi:hypothetical protein
MPPRWGSSFFHARNPGLPLRLCANFSIPPLPHIACTPLAVFLLCSEKINHSLKQPIGANSSSTLAETFSLIKKVLDRRASGALYMRVRFRRMRELVEEKTSMLTNLTITRQTASWQACAAMTGAGLCVEGLGSSKYNPIIGGQSLHHQTPESLRFSDRRQVST